MKRILCLIDSLASGGAQRQMCGLATLLKQKGYIVLVLTYFDIPFYLHQLQEEGVDNEYVSCRSSLVDRLFKISHSIRRFNPDVVISFLDTPSILACLLHIAHKKKWKLIVSERNTTQTLSLRERIKFTLYRFADCIVPNSYSQKDYLAIHYPSLCKKSHVITNFVDTDSFIPQKTKCDSSILRIIGVGRVLRQKNIPLLIEAVTVLREKGRRFRVDWYGARFDTYNECMHLIMLNKLEDVFVFHEPCRDIIEKYQQSDLFVLPSIYEGFPNVLCEAMSCGLPVIATNICDNGRIVRHNENGFLFPSGDTMQLVESLIRFMDLPQEKRAAMGEKSRLLALEMFSKEVFVKEYIRLFN